MSEGILWRSFHCNCSCKNYAKLSENSSSLNYITWKSVRSYLDRHDFISYYSFFNEKLSNLNGVSGSAFPEIIGYNPQIECIVLWCVDSQSTDIDMILVLWTIGIPFFIVMARSLARDLSMASLCRRWNADLWLAMVWSGASTQRFWEMIVEVMLMSWDPLRWRFLFDLCLASYPLRDVELFC